MNSTIVGERIASLRKKKGYTQAQLAQILSVSSKTVSRWETGEGFPEIGMFPALAKTLEISVDQLLAEEEGWQKHNLKGKNGDTSKKEILLLALGCLLLYEAGLVILFMLRSQINTFSIEAFQRVNLIFTISRVVLIAAALCAAIFATRYHRKKYDVDSDHLPVTLVVCAILCEGCKLLMRAVYWEYFSWAQGTQGDTYELLTGTLAKGEMIVEIIALMLIVVAFMHIMKNSKVLVSGVLTIVLAVGIAVAIGTDMEAQYLLSDEMIIKTLRCLFIVRVGFLLYVEYRIPKRKEF